MADVYLNTGKIKPKTTKYKLDYKGNTYHFNNESDYKTLLEELQEIDKLQDKNKKFMK
jgi:YHS domain-containing protein|tara:strand:+ start:297 stop:470 length:174 start_codon:yes stop_codon:yes gene_type:complete